MIKGDRLKKLRKDKLLTQEQLGEMIGVKKSTICCYEKGTRTPSIENIIDFIHIFGVDADYLLGTDYIVKTFEDKDKEIITTMTIEEITFLEELKKNKMVYNILLEEPKRGAELVKTKIG